MSFLADLRFVRAYLVVGVAAVVAYRWVGGNPAYYWAIALYGAAGTVAGALRGPRGQRLPWLLLASGVVLWVGGDIAWEVIAMGGDAPSSPNASDAFCFVAYPTVAAALFLLTRHAAGGRLATTIDASIVAVTASIALWPLLFATVAEDGQTLSTRLTVGVYPSWDIVFVVLCARIALTRAMHVRRMLLLLGSMSLFLTGDAFWFDSVNTYALGDWMDFAWLAAYVGFGAAALHPTAVQRSGGEGMAPLARFALLAVPIALLPAALVLEALAGYGFTIVDAALMATVLLLLLGRLGAVVSGLERARAELREQNRLKDELLSIVSHDLRTPLTSVMGYLELALGDDVEADEKQGFLEVVRRNTDRLHRLVEDLLFVSRVQSGAHALEIAPVDVASLVHDTVAAFAPQAEAADVELGCDVAADVVLLADGHRVAEVLENLLSNAVKFTPPAGRVAVGVAVVSDTCVIRVSDTGIGIDAEDQRHLFDRFFRASGADGIPGAGLGLSIVKAIVDAHGGRIDVDSTVGAGTTFQIRLPLLVAEPRIAAAA